MKSKLIIITGLAATGKSWVANELSDSLEIPQIPKDRIKVEILGQLGVKDRVWDIQVGITAVKLQMKIAHELLCRKHAVTLESNYKQEYDAPLILDLIEKTLCDCLQIVCGADGAILIERYIKRTLSGERPMELNEYDNIEEFRPKLHRGFDDPLCIPGKVIRVDTTDFSKVDMSQLLASVREFLISSD